MGQKKHKYNVKLTAEERDKLNRLTLSGSIDVRKLNRVKILLLADEQHEKGNKTDNEIAEKLDISRATVVRIRRRYIEKDLDAAINENPRSGRPPEISGETRAQITALACSDAPEGFGRWTLRLLADKLVELDFVDNISHNTVGEILKKNVVKPQLRREWCLGKLTPTFLWKMEKILGIYALPYDPKKPLWCYDERPCVLIGDTIVPLPVEPGKPQRRNYEYERHGVCSVLFAIQPHTGLCFVWVREQRTGKDYAEFMAALVEAHCPKDGQIVLIQDNLNTHEPTSFYKTFKPEIAFALMNKLDMHYTPTKASWLNMAEIALSALAKQCLDRRIPSIDTLKREVMAWVQQRNAHPVPIHWQFTPEMAREKFKRFYPDITAKPEPIASVS